MTNQSVQAPADTARDRLAALLAHHADTIAAALRADARTGLPENRAGVGRAAELLDLHAAHLTEDEETLVVQELLDSILEFEAARPTEHAAHVIAERNCLAMATLFALQWKPNAPMSLRDGIEEILATMPARPELSIPAAPEEPQ
ncbi:hypothetical protein B1H20_16815 [Streptomyces violaceoruber]|uniref:Uncharacterized protein n=1 Tax=Streptomyces violaceoruber TaxID=1935 RepID=A0A1V0UCA9_STRVN|nr:hypothetical protein [Streptomyces violaceoruber]ARF62864.1 hypothetical protein B1H20_16815 [Streptomyces violaceoruber]